MHSVAAATDRTRTAFLARLRAVSNEAAAVATCNDNANGTAALLRWVLLRAMCLATLLSALLPVLEAQVSGRVRLALLRGDVDGRDGVHLGGPRNGRGSPPLHLTAMLFRTVAIGMHLRRAQTGSDEFSCDVASHMGR